MSVKLFSFYTVSSLTHIVPKKLRLIILSKYNTVKNELFKTKFPSDYVCQAISFRGAKAWMSGCYRLERRASDNIFVCLYYRIWCALDQEQGNSKSLSGRLLVVWTAVTSGEGRGHVPRRGRIQGGPVNFQVSSGNDKVIMKYPIVKGQSPLSFSWYFALNEGTFCEKFLKFSCFSK